MGKFAFVFPGQGTHYVGMGIELAERHAEAAAVFDQAQHALGVDIFALCRDGPESELVKTENAQPAIHTCSLAALKVIEKYGFAAEFTAGFSLGEYAALVYAGVLKFEDSVRLVKQRGLLMQAAVAHGLGKMCWITGLDRPAIEHIVTEASTLGLIECSNFNCPQQIIVAGYSAPVERAADLARQRGASAMTFLNVSGPFHTSLLRGAGEQLQELLRTVPLGRPRKKVISNVTASYFVSADDIPRLLNQHVHKAVRWEECVNTLLDDAVDTFVEIGPRHLLSNFIQSTAQHRGREVRTFNVEDAATLEVFLREVGPT